MPKGHKFFYFCEKIFNPAAQKNLAALKKKLPGKAILVAELNGWLNGQMEKYNKILKQKD